VRKPHVLSVLILVATALIAPPAQADRASSHYHQAMALKKRRNYKAAIAKLKDALRARSDYAAAHRSIGILYRKLKMNNKAIHHLEKAVKLESSSGQAFYSLGLAYYTAGKRKKALAALEKAAALDPKNARLVATLGSLMMRKDPERALAYLKKAITLDSRNANHYHQLGVAYRRAAGRALRQKNKAKHDEYMTQAEKQLLVALRMKESSADLHFDLGVLYRRLGKGDKAIRHYSRAVALNPKLSAAWWDLGHAYKVKQQHAAAIKAFQKYIGLRAGTGSARIAQKRIDEIKAKQK
jgi:tetratricopeptide (TPR) repeat protein